MADPKARTQAARKAWQTRRRISAFAKARAAEAASKEALRAYCEKRRWRVAFFEGPTGSPRTGIVDAIVFSIDRKDPDRLDSRLVQLKGGRAGVSGAEIARLKRAAKNAGVSWAIAAFDGDTLHIVPDWE